MENRVTVAQGLVASIPKGLDADEFLVQLVEAAMLRERNTCAEIVDEYVRQGQCASVVAASIRARRW
jgi:hypothetical protein